MKEVNQKIMEAAEMFEQAVNKMVLTTKHRETLYDNRQRVARDKLYLREQAELIGCSEDDLR